MHDTISIAHHLTSFRVTEETKIVRTRNGTVTGTTGVMTTAIPRVCPSCGGMMHIHQRHHINLQHFPLMARVHVLHIGFVRSKCEDYGCIKCQDIPFKVSNHRIIKPLMTLIAEYLAKGFTLTETSHVLHIHPPIVRDIDVRLKRMFPAQFRILWDL